VPLSGCESGPGAPDHAVRSGRASDPHTTAVLLARAIDHELAEDGADRGDLRLIASRSRAWRGVPARRAVIAPPRQHPARGSRRRCGYGVIAMTAGKDPTLIGLSAWLVAVRIGVTVPALPGAESSTT
jgi:hypothetical protein